MQALTQKHSVQTITYKRSYTNTRIQALTHKHSHTNNHMQTITYKHSHTNTHMQTITYKHSHTNRSARKQSHKNTDLPTLTCKHSHTNTHIKTLAYKHSHTSLTAYIRDTLHWLPVAQRISYRVAVLVRRCLIGSAPAYLCELSSSVSSVSGRRALRSSVAGQVWVPRATTATRQRQSFSIVGPST